MSCSETPKLQNSRPTVFSANSYNELLHEFLALLVQREEGHVTRVTFGVLAGMVREYLYSSILPHVHKTAYLGQVLGQKSEITVHFNPK